MYILYKQKVSASLLYKCSNAIMKLMTWNKADANELKKKYQGENK